jgi:hypothetical protein
VEAKNPYTVPDPPQVSTSIAINNQKAAFW